ncbi:MAG TPA: hypothetical protein VIH59_03980 [Candidatus Tectomicrobia bacterium]
MDELFAVLIAVKEGEVTEAEAIQRRRVPRIGCGWRWTRCASSS